MDFRLLTYVRENDRPRAGLFVEEKGVIDIEAVLDSDENAIDDTGPVSMLTVLNHWETVFPVLMAVATDSSASGSSRFIPLSDIRLTAPILYPSTIYCAAANYLDHRKEMGGSQLPDKEHARPFFFTKLPRQTVIGPGEAIRIPYPEAKVDWEAEIGVVIGRRCRKWSHRKPWRMWRDMLSSMISPTVPGFSGATGSLSSIGSAGNPSTHRRQWGPG